ncbi:MAG: methyltransferase domain-containing protein [Deltaproteobacteria bacterium]|nr:methyltransferase domain-containing protein [Deltaproteobacteria bacterium]
MHLIALVAISLWVFQTLSQAVRAEPIFPAPNRPVAEIISAEYSDEKTRDLHQEAERVMDRLGIKPGVRVADVGAGRGYYTVRLAARLGTDTIIYATDVNANHLKELQVRLKREGIGGVRLVLGSPNDPKLPPAVIDVAILSHVYHEIDNPYEFMYRLHRSLAPGARVGIVDVDRPTDLHGTPPGLLRCELGSLGYRETAFQSLKPADGYLAVFVPPEKLPLVESLRPCNM